MGNSENCWVDLIEDCSDDSARNVKPYFEEKARELGEATGGKVTAVFERVADLNAENNPHIAAGVALEKALASSKPEGFAPKRKDANELYSDAQYAFEIRTESYRFRVFKLRLGGIFPVKMYVDEGVYGELDRNYESASGERGESVSISLRSEAEVDEIFEEILKTRKVRYLVKRLFEIASEAEEG